MSKNAFHRSRHKPGPPRHPHQAPQQSVEGRLQLRGRFGFILSEDPAKQDVYVTGPSLLQAMDGDRVQARIIPGRRREGVIEKVVKRARSTAVGIYRVLNGKPMLVPEDSAVAPVRVLGHGHLSVKDGQAAVVHITQWPHAGQPAGGVLKEVLGWPQDPGVDIRVILGKRELQENFPPEVLREAAALPGQVNPSGWSNRGTFFHLPVFTIDGPDAKDFDDALSLERLPSGQWRLGVHIADASEYVTLGSALDKEAADRATSVYPVGGVVPMLPPKLSEDLCSLKPHVERLTLSCLMDLDDHGRVASYRISESAVKSARRYTYEAVQAVLDRHGPDRDPAEKSLREMARLARTLRAGRMRRGSLDFSFPESKVVLDQRGEPIDIIRVENLESHRLVEEFMLLANETVASHLRLNKLPALYRIHESPNPEKLRKLVEVLKVFGIHAPAKLTEGTHEALAEVLRHVKGRPDQNVINRLILRTLKQAVYSTKNQGHYGLASSCYTHFTSPIRRYPDLCVHRILKSSLRGNPSPALRSWEHGLPQIALHSSLRERLAQEAEWESQDLKKVKFMKSRVGKAFSGIITSVTSFGFFVELADYQVEGLVRVESLEDDYYLYDEMRLTLRGRRTHRVFHPGQKVHVLLADANESKRQMEFQLIRKDHK